MMAKHCAKFTDDLLPLAVEMLQDEGAEIVLDPFAGTGKGVEYLRAKGFKAWGLELEPEWAECSQWVDQGDALDNPYPAQSFDAVFTSPTYGNRMADRDMRPSVAGTYVKSLGRHASEGSSCHLQWGDAYRDFHAAAWIEVKRVLTPRGVFLLNIKDHVRGGKVQPVSLWHCQTLGSLGFDLIRQEFVRTPSLRNGRNGDARVNGEWLLLFRKREGRKETHRPCRTFYRANASCST